MNRAWCWCVRRVDGPARRGTADAGSAVVEFVFLAVLMMIPVCYLVMVMARVQAGAYAVSAASREAVRAYVTSPTTSGAAQRADAAAGLAFTDQGFSGQGQVQLQCDGEPCLRPEGRVGATATVGVPLPFVPALLQGVLPTEVPVTATHSEVVERFGGLQ